MTTSIALAALIATTSEADANSSAAAEKPLQQSVRQLKRSGGTIAWSLHGQTGPLVVGMPGMGDLRRHWDGFATALSRSGYRVAVLDLRGHGESDTGFEDMSREAMAQDALALADSLSPDEPVTLVGHSYTGASVAWAAAQHPERVRAVVMLAPFALEHPLTFVQSMSLKLGLLRPWGASVWAGYYASLFPVRKPASLEVQRKAVRENMAQPGRLEALRAMGRTSIATCEAALPRVKAPNLVVFGSRDPDFPDPAAEGRAITALTHGTSIVIPDAGHYPHEEDPEGTARLVADFLAETASAGAGQ